MSKKIFALVMIVSILGGVLSGCQPKAEEETPATPTTPAPDAE